MREGVFRDVREMKDEEGRNRWSSAVPSEGAGEANARTMRRRQARLIKGEVEHVRTQALLMLLKAQFELYNKQREGTNGLGGASVLDGTSGTNR